METNKRSSFEEKIFETMRVPDPAPEFRDRLWERIAAEPLSALHSEITEIAPKKPKWTLSSTIEWLLKLRRPARLLVPLVIVVLLGTALLFTPEGKIFAQNFLNLFRRHESDTLIIQNSASDNSRDPNGQLRWGKPQALGMLPAASDETPEVYTCGLNGQEMTCSMDKLREMTEIPLWELGQVPQSFRFWGASVEEGIVTLSYATENRDKFLMLTQSKPDALVYRVGASATVEPINVAEIPGEYVRGTFSYISGSEEAEWDSEADQQALRWERDGVMIQLMNGGTLMMSKDALIELAQNLTTEPVEKEPFESWLQSNARTMLLSQYPDNWYTVCEKAGFEVLAPSELPVSMMFFGAGYNADTKVVKAFYPFMREGIQDISTNGLVITQGMLSADLKTHLGQFMIADQVGPNDDVTRMAPSCEQVSIGEITGQYVEGTWNLTDQGPVWENTPWLKQLRWRVGERGFELLYMGNELSRDDLSRIANGIRVEEIPSATPAQPVYGETPLAEFPMTLEAAQKEAGFLYLLPQLGDGLWFQGAAFDAYFGVGSAFYAAEGSEIPAGLIIRQETVVNLPVELAAFGEVGTTAAFTAVPRSAMAGRVEEIDLKGTDASYTEGSWVMRENAWRWEPDAAAKRLRFQTADRAFELMTLGQSGLTRSDLIQIAETMVD